eukprot:Nk52_evm48s164 gene=Nk52_evmTU48s164
MESQSNTRGFRNERIEEESRNLCKYLEKYKNEFNFIQCILVWQNISLSGGVSIGVHLAVYCVYTSDISYLTWLSVGVFGYLIFEQCCHLIDFHLFIPVVKNTKKFIDLKEFCDFAIKVKLQGKDLWSSLDELKRDSPGKYCCLMCALSVSAAILGTLLRGVLLVHLLMFVILSGPAFMYHRILNQAGSYILPYVKIVNSKLCEYIHTSSLSGYLTSSSQHERTENYIDKTFDVDGLSTSQLSLNDSVMNDFMGSLDDIDSNAHLQSELSGLVNDSSSSFVTSTPFSKPTRQGDTVSMSRKFSSASSDDYDMISNPGSNPDDCAEQQK